jgi:hypothetical protein
MTNAYRMTKDKSLDRQYLRVAAVYRCVSRFGAGREFALTRLSERMPTREASALISIWAQRRELSHLRRTA